MAAGFRSAAAATGNPPASHRIMPLIIWRIGHSRGAAHAVAGASAIMRRDYTRHSAFVPRFGFSVSRMHPGRLMLLSSGPAFHMAGRRTWIRESRCVASPNTIGSHFHKLPAALPRGSSLGHRPFAAEHLTLDKYAGSFPRQCSCRRR